MHIIVCNVFANCQELVIIEPVSGDEYLFVWYK